MTLIRRKRCENCAHSSDEICLQNGRYNASLSKDQIECRRNAPSWGSGTGTGGTDQLYPFVSKYSWCGEWTEKLPNMVVWEEGKEVVDES